MNIDREKAVLTAGLRRVRRQLLREYCREQLPVKLLSLAPLAIGGAAGGLISGWSAVGAVLSGAVGWCLAEFRVRFGSLRCAAERFDAALATRNRCVIAWELAMRREFTPFSAYAVIQGAAALAVGTPRGRLLPPMRRFHWQNALPMVAALLLVAVWHSPGKLEESSPQEEGESLSMISVTDGKTPLPEPEDPEKRAAAGEVHRSATPGGAGRSAAAVPTAGRGQGRGKSAAEPWLRDPAPPKDSAAEPQTASRAGEPELNTSAGDSGSWGDAGVPENPMLSMIGKAAAGQERAKRSVRRNSTRRQPETAQEGAQPLLPDHAPPAGRELSEKEGEGDPDNGRGGPSGEKKARGTASMLPVTPLPDLVRGVLSPGEEQRSPEPAGLPEPEVAPGEQPLPASPGIEPMQRRQFGPRPIRNYLMQTEEIK